MVQKTSSVTILAYLMKWTDYFTHSNEWMEKLAARRLDCNKLPWHTQENCFWCTKRMSTTISSPLQFKHSLESLNSCRLWWRRAPTVERGTSIADKTVITITIALRFSSITFKGMKKKKKASNCREQDSSSYLRNYWGAHKKFATKLQHNTVHLFLSNK